MHQIIAVQKPTIKLTFAQALVRHLARQVITRDGVEQRLFQRGFSIFGHGNVTWLGQALYEHRNMLPVYREQSEQSMGFAAAGYAKQKLTSAGRHKELDVDGIFRGLQANQQ